MGARIVLFDLGHVVVDWQPIRLYRDLFDTEAEADVFVRDVCNMDWHVHHDRGVSMADNAEPLIAQYPQYETQIRAWRTRRLDMFEGYIPGMPPLMAPGTGWPNAGSLRGRGGPNASRHTPGYIRPTSSASSQWCSTPTSSSTSRLPR